MSAENQKPGSHPEQNKTTPGTSPQPERVIYNAAFSERKNAIETILRRRQEAERLLTDPEFRQVQVTPINDIPGISHDITVSFGPMKSLGGWRQASEKIITQNYERAVKNNPEYIESMINRPGIPDDIRAKAGVLEATGLGGDMVLKWAGAVATMKYAKNKGFYSPTLQAHIDDLIDASHLSGGKSVAVKEIPGKILGEDRRKLIRHHADHITRFNQNRGDGKHITAPDMGSTMPDMTALYVLGTDVASMAAEYGGSEEPSPITALGVFHGIKSMLEFQKKDGNSMNFAIQGAAGEVGHRLLAMLRKEYTEASIYVSDIPERTADLKELERKYCVEIVEGDQIFKQGGMFVPSGPSEQLTDERLTLLNESNTTMVVGPANYLYPIGKEKEMSEKYHTAGILIAPAPLVNQGGIRNIAAVELMRDTGKKPLKNELIEEVISDVGPMLSHVLKRAKTEKKTPEAVFREIALDEFAELCVKNGIIN